MGTQKSQVRCLDELLDQMNSEHSKNLDESFEAWDNFNKDENQNHLYNNIFVPSQQDLYNGIVKELNQIFENNDEAKVYNKEKEIKKAVNSGLKKYFGSVNPQFLKVMESYNMNEEEQYEFLTGLYDEQVGFNPRDNRKEAIKSIRSLVDQAKDKKLSVGHIKRQLPSLTSNHADGALGYITNKYGDHHFSKYHATEIAAYLKPKFEKEGLEIDDKVKYATASIGQLLQLRERAVEKERYEPLLKKKEEPQN